MILCSLDHEAHGEISWCYPLYKFVYLFIYHLNQVDNGRVEVVSDCLIMYKGEWTIWFKSRKPKKGKRRFKILIKVVKNDILLTNVIDIMILDRIAWQRRILMNDSNQLFCLVFITKLLVLD